MLLLRVEPDVVEIHASRDAKGDVFHVRRRAVLFW
jgi:hypothetical protein